LLAKVTHVKFGTKLRDEHGYKFSVKRFWLLWDNYLAPIKMAAFFSLSARMIRLQNDQINFHNILHRKDLLKFVDAPQMLQNQTKVTPP
jgi:hypothetical protein